MRLRLMAVAIASSRLRGALTVAGCYAALVNAAHERFGT
jgi:hypothetical protein